MKTSFIKTVVLPLVAAMIWGAAFAAQSVSAELVPPFAFNTARNIVAIVPTAIMLAVFTAIKKRRGTYEKPSGGMKSLIIGGICCGTVLCIASSFQQAGLGNTDAGKASFITALYIVLVPLLGVFFRRRTGITTAISVAIAVAGMYLLCIGEGFSIQKSDLLVLACALFFALHILVIDYFAPSTDGIALSLVQFIVCGIESGILMIIFERPSLDGIIASLGGILYVGIFSSGVAYTLQIIAQKGSDPTVVSLLLSLESVFGALAGAIFLHEVMSGREYFGCALMLCAVMLSQIPRDVWKRLIERIFKQQN